MAQINKGTTYTTSNSVVTIQNLNDHVDLATLQPGCISEQPSFVGTPNQNADQILLLSSSNLKKATLSQIFPALTGDVSSSAGSTSITVNKLLNRSISSSSPSEGQLLKWNSTLSQWEPKTPINFLTPVSLTNQTFVDFTAIPSYAKKLTVLLSRVSTASSGVGIVIQLGSGSPQATGYSGGLANIGKAGSTVQSNARNFTDGLSVELSATGGDFSGAERSGVISMYNISENVWVMSGVVSCAFSTGVSSSSVVSNASVSLPSTLNVVRITTTSGTDSLDSGTVNLIWE
jgi:hypothetical protein